MLGVILCGFNRLHWIAHRASENQSRCCCCCCSSESKCCCIFLPYHTSVTALHSLVCVQQQQDCGQQCRYDNKYSLVLLYHRDHALQSIMQSNIQNTAVFEFQFKKQNSPGVNYRISYGVPVHCCTHSSCRPESFHKQPIIFHSMTARPHWVTRHAMMIALCGRL